MKRQIKVDLETRDRFKSECKTVKGRKIDEFLNEVLDVYAMYKKLNENAIQTKLNEGK